MKTILRTQHAPHDDTLSQARFRRDVLAGLSQPAKELPCKYFYDERGAQLFEEICELDEYYLTRAELSILEEHAGEMADRLGTRCGLIEFGSGSSRKTRLLLDRLQDPAVYVPIDVAGPGLARSAKALAERYPDLNIKPLCADFTTLRRLPETSSPVRRRVVYFPGSTIGNFDVMQTARLLRRIHDLCGSGGGLLLGVDLKKDRHTLERAYNDAKGVTRAFNLNLLRRINRELDADFQLDDFEHRAVYNDRWGRIEMHLISLRRQTARIGAVAIPFSAGESIRTECSYKVDVDEFAQLAARAGLQLQNVWLDEQRLFSVLLFRVA